MSDGLALLQSGQAAMHMSGTWNIEDFSNPEKTTEPIGFFFLPSINGKPVVVPGGIGSGWVVSSATKNPRSRHGVPRLPGQRRDGAALGDGNQRRARLPCQHGRLGRAGTAVLCLGIISEQADSMGYNIDVVTPDNFNKVMWDGFAAVLAGSKTPEQQAADLEAAMQEAVEKGNAVDITGK